MDENANNKEIKKKDALLSKYFNKVKKEELQNNERVLKLADHLKKLVENQPVKVKNKKKDDNL